MVYFNRAAQIESAFEKTAERVESDQKWAFLFTLITVIGSVAVGAGLLLSEILFAEIDFFSDCPQWYKAFFTLALALAITGTLGCAVVKKPLNGKLFTRYLKERRFYAGVAAVGVIITFVAALFEKESFALNVIICFGGALCGFGSFAFLGSAIGFLSAAKNNEYLKLLNKLRKKNAQIQLADCAYFESVCALEEELTVNLPAELIDFYMQTDGDGALLYRANGALSVTEQVRLDGAPFNEELLNVLCIGDDCDGNCFCYKIKGGTVVDNKIYVIERESLQILPVADNLRALIALYYGGYLADINANI